jgi:hypothetical protein
LTMFKVVYTHINQKTKEQFKVQVISRPLIPYDQAPDAPVVFLGSMRVVS